MTTEFDQITKKLEERPFLVENVVIAKEGFGDAALVALDGRELVFRLDGDCCSSSFFPDCAIEDLKSLFGHRLLSISDDEANGAAPREPTAAEEDTYDQISLHVMTVRTDKASLSIDWRNDSNGYYDGTISAELRDGP